MEKMKKISCCINTYKRPELLKKLLISLINQKLDDDITFEIIVVDNDPIKLGESVVKEILRSTNFQIRYFTQPEKNIALTRNVAVHQAKYEYICFIDDDEYADPLWMSNLINCLLKYNADAVFGSVLPYFSEETPSWIKEIQFFYKLSAPTGEFPKFVRTSNCIAKTNILKSIDGPFDLNYGLTGGSDTHLFTTLLQKGVKYVSCTEAIVYDFVPPDRANLKWLIQRSFRTGNSYTRRVIEFAKNKFTIRTKLFLRAILFLFISLFLMILNLPSRKKFINWTLKLMGNIGHLMAIFNFHYVEYK